MSPVASVGRQAATHVVSARPWTGWLAAGALAALLLVPLGIAWRMAPDLGHGWAAPLLIGYLLWERWRERPPARASAGWGWGWLAAAVALAAAALPLRLLLVPFPLWPALVWVYTGLLVGAALAAAWLRAGGPGVRWLAGPLSILPAALPWPYQLQQHIVAPLREGMASLAAEISNLLGHPALAAGTTVEIGTAWIGVDEACGGIRSLQASIMIALFFGEWYRFSWRRRGILVVLAAGAASLGNFLRILFLALQAGNGATLAAVHDAAGWIALAFSLAATGWAARRWARRWGQPAADEYFLEPAAARRGIFSSPWTWLGLVAALLAADEAGARWWFARGEAARADVPHWTVRLPENHWDFQYEGLTDLGREMLSPDYYIAGHWRAGANRSLAAYYVEWRQGQVARFIPFMHNPTVCLPMAGCDLVGSLGIIPVRWAGGEILFHGYIFHRAGVDLAVAFTIWDSARGGPLEKPAEAAGWSGWFLSRWDDVRAARKDQPAQLLSLAIAGPDARAQLGPVLQTLIVRP